MQTLSSTAVIEALTNAVAAGLIDEGLPADSLQEIRWDRRHQDHADLSTNAAMSHAKLLGLNAHDLAQRLAAHVTDQKVPHLLNASAAGPGFLNIHLKPAWLHDTLSDILSRGADYARSDIGQRQTVSLEYVSANPTGPLHAGGGRWGAYGDSLARMFRYCGYRTRTEYYVNDGGTQMHLFGRSLVARMLDEPLPEDGYNGEYVREWADEMRRDIETQVPDAADLRSALRSVGGIDYAVSWGKDRALREVNDALAAMNVSFDHWQSEREIIKSGATDRIVTMLHDDGWLIDRDDAVWAATSQFGDDKDRVLIRSNGKATYFLPDIAYHHGKFAHSRHVIDILGADHHSYATRMTAAMQMLGHPSASYEPIIGQNVTLMRDGQEVKISKRTGNIVEVSELVDVLGPDITRFAYLLQSINSHQTIDIDTMSAQAAENPVFYVQYAHARIKSLQRKAVSRGVEPVPAAADLSLLTHEKELAVLRHLEHLPTVVLYSLDERAPHKVTAWVRDLAAAYHQCYTTCSVLSEGVSAELRDARLAFTEGTRIGLSVALDLLGVSLPESM